MKRFLKAFKILWHWLGFIALFVTSPLVIIGSIDYILKDITNPQLGYYLVAYSAIFAILYVWYLIIRHYINSVYKNKKENK